MFFLTLIIFIVIFSVLILIHELGHFVAAKRANVKVEEFGFGLPPRLWGFKKGETIYSINWIPFGGFVRMLGEDSSTKEAQTNKRSFANQSLRTQAWIVVAGVVMNFLLAFVLLTVGFWIGIEPLMVDEQDFLNAVRNEQVELTLDYTDPDKAFYIPRLVYKENDITLESVDGRQVLSYADFQGAVDQAYVEKRREVTLKTFDPSTGGGYQSSTLALAERHPLLTFIEPESPAEGAGLQLHDEILSVEGEAVNLAAHVIELTAASTDETLSYQVRRGEEVLNFEIPKREDGRIGVALADTVPSYPVLELYETPVAHQVVEVKKLQYGWKAPVVAIQEMGRLGKLTAVMFVKVLGGFFVGNDLPAEVSGPVGIAQMTGVYVQEGFAAVIRFVALLSLSLGVINILPIPALDGGRFAFILYQVITGRKPNPKTESMIHGAGFVVLLIFIAYVTFNDVLRLI